MAGLVRLFKDVQAYAEADAASAAKLVGEGGRGRSRPICRAAAWVTLARTVMNLDEFVTRE